MNRKFWLLPVLLLTSFNFAEAQQSAKIPRIGYVIARVGTATNPDRFAQAFRQRLKDLGYVEGKNIAIEFRSTEGKGPTVEAERTRELIRLNVDVLVASSYPSIRAAKEATKTIPVVMVTTQDPVARGLIDTLARPGGNVTGITNLGRALGGKRLELLKEAVPKVSRVAVLYDPALPGTELDVKEVLPVSARALGLTIEPWDVRAAGGFEKVFAAVSKQRPDGLYVPPSGPLMFANPKTIAGFALKSRLPSMYLSREYVDAGGLMSYGADLADSYRRVAYFVDKILKGAKPADLPVEQPTKFELVINLRTARQMGLTIPPNVLARADKVIK